MDVENVVFVADLLEIASRTTTNKNAITADQVKEVVGWEMTDLVDQEIVSENGTVRDGRLLEALVISLTGCFACNYQPSPWTGLFVDTSLLINPLQPLWLKWQTYYRYRNSRGQTIYVHAISF